ncbi:NAD(P)-binding protein [Bacillus chungangensis]|uniref:precorrin-2 dehydrogenase n=1 Tax=Bacillus chungangensis TaxID=587633 RepID=A0ABT9WT99_9BACI|nr:NAD(P)-binding protein [Bacillus chungangensis]MDQ0176529.1 precorrin-2 dehydrogenase/sirohydrochlorin ferrochelatase [Bacillus chungangensis]
MGTYPIMLHVKNKNVIVVGGGKVAYKKITSLLIAGADITVISPTVISPIKKLVDERQIRWLQKTVKREDLRDAFVIIAATNNEKVNKLIAQSSSSHQLVNVVDNQKTGNFQVPATLRRGKLTIAVATSGASPKLAKMIRNELAEIYDESYESYLDFLYQYREKIKQLKLDDRTKDRMLEEILHEKKKNLS